MKSEKIPPKEGSVKALRDEWFDRRDKLRKKNQEESKKDRDQNKKTARPHSEEAEL